MKCIKEYLTSICDKKEEDPVLCVDCRGDHSANYSKCEVYLKYLQKIDLGRDKTKYVSYSVTEQLSVKTY